jgi:hypothetical protein
MDQHGPAAMNLERRHDWTIADVYTTDELDHRAPKKTEFAGERRCDWRPEGLSVAMTVPIASLSR